MSYLDDFKASFEEGLPAIVQQNVMTYAAAARKDAETFLRDSESDVKRWLAMLSEKRLTKREFSDLVHGRQSLAIMAGLAETGVALATIQRFRNSLIDLVVNSAFQALHI